MKKMLRTVSAVLAALLVLLTFTGCNMFTFGEEETTTVEYSTSLTEKPVDTAKTIEYFNKLLEKAVNLPVEERPDIKWSESIKVSDKSIKITSALVPEGDESVTLEKETESIIEDLNNIAPIVKNYIVAQVPKQKSATTVPDKNGEGATPYEEILYGAGGLTAFDTSFAVVVEDNTEENLYKITIRFNDEYNPTANSSRIGKAFDLRSKDDIFKSLNNEAMAEYAKVNDYDASYKNCSITAVVNRLTDELISITYSKNVDVTAKVTMLGKFAKAGDLNIKFSVEDKREYEFAWPVAEEA